jgi:hypothetical protein
MFSLMARLTWLLVRIVLCFIFYGTPLIGLWVASSLAAYLGGPHWVAWTAGALLFPIVPGLWELHSWSRRRPGRKAWFTPLDRVSMRTFVVGLVFLAVLLYLYPQTAFVSLSTRGDWMLDKVKDPRAQTARRFLFASAGGLEWLYRATRNNPYKSHIDTNARQRMEEAARQAEQELARQREQQLDHQHGQETAQKQEQETAQKLPEETTQKLPQETAQKQQPEIVQKREQKTAHQHEQKTAQLTNPAVKWPWKHATLHPAVAAMPNSVETSIQSVAQYIAKRESDPVLRIKALHDYVADRIAYDSDAFYSGHYPDQDAEAVFETRKGVCAGYANLLSGLATAINLDYSPTGNRMGGIFD